MYGGGNVMFEPFWWLLRVSPPHMLALASNGEICCTYNEDGTCDYLAEGDCAEGIEKYKTEYIDPLVKILADYHEKVPIALVIEPDSLPNLASNLGETERGGGGVVLGG